MKKITFVLVILLLGVTDTFASEKLSETNSKELSIKKRYRFTQPILFVERGVEFLIFPNGEFDFNTEPDYGFSNIYYKSRNSKRRSFNGTFGAPGARTKYHRSGGVYIKHDRYGRVRRIGNVFINYDYQGRVKRIGTVYMRYRHGLLKQVGGLHIQYNRWGTMIGTRGYVNWSNKGCGLCGTSGCTADHFDTHYDNDWQDNDWDDYNDDYYYYRKGGKTLKKQKKHRFKKRH